jgi:hypothetical protein
MLASIAPHVSVNFDEKMFEDIGVFPSLDLILEEIESIINSVGVAGKLSPIILMMAQIMEIFLCLCEFLAAV